MLPSVANGKSHSQTLSLCVVGKTHLYFFILAQNNIIPTPVKWKSYDFENHQIEIQFDSINDVEVYQVFWRDQVS